MSFVLEACYMAWFRARKCNNRLENPAKSYTNPTSHVLSYTLSFTRKYQ